MKNWKKGFTLIELIIVIAIIGILAAGLIVALNPVEQINRGRDANLRNIAVEVIRGMQRYYTNSAQTTRPGLPWVDASISPAVSTYPSDQSTNTNNVLTASGELKAAFPTGATGLTVYATSDTTGFVCFSPTSNSFRLDPNYKYVITGGQPAASCTTGAGGNCTTWCMTP